MVEVLGTKTTNISLHYSNPRSRQMDVSSNVNARAVTAYGTPFEHFSLRTQMLHR
jgi:hypothetical protein